MDFQRVNRLRVDGIVGVQTQIALNSALNLPNTPVLARNE
jgi:peptidoglycan hydrolase-like protein with peptidoglycan-binding domain